MNRYNRSRVGWASAHAESRASTAKQHGLRPILLVLPLLCLATPAQAYIDMAPTLAKVMTDSKSIAVVEVTEFDRAKHIVVLKGIRALKGELAADPIRHEVASDEGSIIPRPILQWAGPGRGRSCSYRAIRLSSVLDKGGTRRV